MTGEIDEADLQLMLEKGKRPMSIYNKDDGHYTSLVYNINKSKPQEPTVRSITIPGTYSPEPGIPGYNKDTNYINQINGILNINLKNEDDLKKFIQSSYDDMVQKVSKNSGFWIGRYHTSGMRNNTTTTYSTSNEVKVRVVKGATSGINNITWYRMYAEQNLYAKKNNITNGSNMLWKCQLLQVIFFIEDVPNVVYNTKYYMNAAGMANLNIAGLDDGYPATTPASTGCFKVKNIYDLTGNLQTWTLEPASATGWVLYGAWPGCTYTDYDNGPLARAIEAGTTTGNSLGSRITLY